MNKDLLTVSELSAGKVEVTSSSVKVNNGAIEVM